MTMTPIARIPQLDSDISLAKTIEGELRNRYIISLEEQLEVLHTHATDDIHISATLDWAMQIRSEFGIDWSSAIDAAMILYFG